MPRGAYDMTNGNISGVLAWIEADNLIKETERALQQAAEDAKAKAAAHEVQKERARKNYHLRKAAAAVAAGKPGPPTSGRSTAGAGLKRGPGRPPKNPGLKKTSSSAAPVAAGGGISGAVSSFGRGRGQAHGHAFSHAHGHSYGTMQPPFHPTYPSSTSALASEAAFGPDAFTDYSFTSATYRGEPSGTYSRGKGKGKAREVIKEEEMELEDEFILNSIEDDEDGEYEFDEEDEEEDDEEFEELVGKRVRTRRLADN
ncbi:hypothetical protein B0J11DRAFT_584017 [Dendryphion nanum]|uniref:Uncharacterized protein n=1 Tax=Dendryphion nanum TaxID=256645 RepID=A0A9P9DB80_9PLEO|nr:hypothetical protein B0J11DRAFT_584017 [Dendryphion nanum]